MSSSVTRKPTYRPSLLRQQERMNSATRREFAVFTTAMGTTTPSNSGNNVQQRTFATRRFEAMDHQKKKNNNKKQKIRDGQARFEQEVAHGTQCVEILCHDSDEDDRSLEHYLATVHVSRHTTDNSNTLILMSSTITVVARTTTESNENRPRSPVHSDGSQGNPIVLE